MSIGADYDFRVPCYCPCHMSYGPLPTAPIHGWTPAEMERVVRELDKQIVGTQEEPTL